MRAEERNILENFPEGHLHEPLSEQENKVLQLAAVGMSNVEIARKLYISAHTVKAHLKSIYIKLGVANRTSAVYFYFCKNNKFSDDK